MIPQLKHFICFCLAFCASLRGGELLVAGVVDEVTLRSSDGFADPSTGVGQSRCRCPLPPHRKQWPFWLPFAPPAVKTSIDIGSELYVMIELPRALRYASIT
jgi:hypothetical protein